MPLSVYNFLFQAGLGEPGSGTAAKSLDSAWAAWRLRFCGQMEAYLDEVNRFTPQDARCTEGGSRGANLATLAVHMGQRFSSPEGILLKMAQKGFDLSVPDDRGQIAVVRGWGDLEALTRDRVQDLMDAGVDFSLADDGHSSVLTSSFTHPFPLQEGVAALLYGGIQRGLERHPQAQQLRRLSRLKSSADPEHHPWLQSMKDALTLSRISAGAPPASGTPSKPRARL